MNKQCTWKEPALAAACALLPLAVLYSCILAIRWFTQLTTYPYPGYVEGWPLWGMAAALSILTRGLVGVSICVLLRVRAFKSRRLNLLAFGLPLAYTMALLTGYLFHPAARVMLGTIGREMLPVLLAACIWRCVELLWKKKQPCGS